MPFWKKKTGGKQTLDGLVRGLQNTVNAASEMLEARNLELLSRYFDENGVAKSRTLRITEHKAVDVPIITVVNPASLNLKEVEMDFTVKIDSIELQEKEDQYGFLNGEKSDSQALELNMARSMLGVSFTGDSNSSNINVKVKFESAPIPEGMSRIIEEYDKVILPYETEE